MNPILQVLFAQALTGVCAHPNSSLSNTRQLATQALAIAEEGVALFDAKYGQGTVNAGTRQPAHAGK